MLWKFPLGAIEFERLVQIRIRRGSESERVTRPGIIQDRHIVIFIKRVILIIGLCLLLLLIFLYVIRLRWVACLVLLFCCFLPVTAASTCALADYSNNDNQEGTHETCHYD